MHATRPQDRRIDADHAKVRQCLSEAREYLAELNEAGDPNLAELAAGRLCDLVLEHRMSRGKLAPR